MMTTACRIAPNFFITYYSLMKKICSLLPIMSTISIPILGPHDANHNRSLECEFSQKLCGVDKKCAMHGAPAVATLAVSIPQKHSLKLALDVQSLPFLSQHKICSFKLAAIVLHWFS